MIGVSNFFARLIAKEVFPTAVGPTITITVCGRMIIMNYELEIKNTKLL
jgi:hypothetical protein